MKAKREITGDIVKQYGFDAGSDVVGIADSADFSAAPEGFRPVDVLPGCRSVIVLGTALPIEVLGDIAAYSASRNAMLTEMTDRAKAVAKRIKADGFSTKAISATGGKWVEVGGGKEQFGYISLKHAAQFAGLGVITRNYLLTNPEYGNRLWLSAVLTDAELEADKKLSLDYCKDCDICVKACPSGALDNAGTVVKKACSQFFKIIDKKFVIQCFKCRTVCPCGLGHGA